MGPIERCTVLDQLSSAAKEAYEPRRRTSVRRHRAVLITRKPSGGLQTSPVLVVVDDEGKLAISTREAAYKTRNLRRDPTAVLCVLSDDFFDAWMQIEGTAQIVSLPEAMAGLVDYYRRISGEHPDWDDYRRAMQQQRVLIRVSINAVGPTHAG